MNPQSFMLTSLPITSGLHLNPPPVALDREPCEKDLGPLQTSQGTGELRGSLFTGASPKEGTQGNPRDILGIIIDGHKIVGISCRDSAGGTVRNTHKTGYTYFLQKTCQSIYYCLAISGQYHSCLALLAFHNYRRLSNLTHRLSIEQGP